MNMVDIITTHINRRREIVKRYQHDDPDSQVAQFMRLAIDEFSDVFWRNGYEDAIEFARCECLQARLIAQDQLSKGYDEASASELAYSLEMRAIANAAGVQV